MSDQQLPQLPTQREGEPDEAETGFHVRLVNFEGPFDLLLQLIGKHKLDVTEIALHEVASEFIAYVTGLDEAWNLEETSEFLLVAATLLDLKTARLLPGTVVDDEEDLALLEARDLLFARLLQYKAYKEAAGALSELAEGAATRVARNVGLEERYKGLLPELVLDLTPDALAALAGKAMVPKPVPTVGTGHIHVQRVSVREHAVILSRRLQRVQTATFRALTSDCETHLEVVARFLALLELYREALVGFEQMQALGELTVRWLGGTGNTEIEVDEYAGAPAEAEAVASDAVSSDAPTGEEPSE